MDRSTPYYRQVQLLLRLLPIIGREPSFALKGGLSVKSKVPDWELLGFKDIDKLPAIRWKLINLEKMPPERHATALEALRKALGMD